MPLPGNLTTIRVTGDAYLTGAGGQLSGYFAFAPNVDLADPTGPAVIRTAPVQVQVSGGVMTPIDLICTDNTDLSPSGWAWTITEHLDGAKVRTWSFYLPSNAGAVIDGVRTVDLAALVPLVTPPTLVQYLLAANDLSDVPDPAAAFENIAQAATTDAAGVVQLPGGTTVFLRGDGTWAVPAGGGGGAVSSVFTRSGAVVAEAGDYSADQISGLGTAATHAATDFDQAGAADTAETNAISAAASSAAGLYIPLSQLPLPIASGGTGHSTQQAALTALAGAQTAGRYLRSDGTNTALATIQAADVPTLNQSTTGTAAGLSATLAIGSGGTGQTSAQAAINALTGAQSAGKFLRSDGANATLAAIQVGDVPTLNQSTTGTAAGLSATLAVGSGGTGQTSQQAAITALTGAQTAGRYLRSDGNNASLAAIQAADVPLLNQNTSGTAAALSTTLAIASGGTGATSAAAALANLGGVAATWCDMLGLGLLTAPPIDSGFTASQTAGNLVCCLVTATKTTTVSTLGIQVTAAGVTGSGVNAMALFTEAAVLIDQTGDMTTAMSSIGFAEGAMGSSHQVVAGTNYYLVVLTHFSGTVPKFAATGTASTANIPVLNGHYVAVFKTAQASIPSSFTPSSFTLNSGQYVMYAR